MKASGFQAVRRSDEPANVSLDSLRSKRFCGVYRVENEENKRGALKEGGGALKDVGE